MRIVALGLLLAGVTSLPIVEVAAQDTTVARLGELVRITAATPSVDSVLRGRLSWSSADSVSVWGHGQATTLSITALRSVEVRRRPRRFTARTAAVATALGLAGGLLGARLGRCGRSSAPPGGIDLGCDTPDTRYRSVFFAILGGAIGTVTGCVVQAIREPAQWTPARFTTQ